MERGGRERRGRVGGGGGKEGERTSSECVDAGRKRGGISFSVNEIHKKDINKKVLEMEERE